MAHIVEVVDRERSGDEIRRQDDGGDREGQYPRPGQRRDRPPLLQATHRRA
jgi:hypothetical protein